MKSKPRISVIIINYNYGKYVGRAIKSVRGQTYSNIELIIVNDGSTDDSDTVIGECIKDDPSITYVSQKNKGANLARNEGIELANGEYIFLLDADNWLDPNHIEQLYQTARLKNADVVYTDLRYVGGGTDVLSAPDFNKDHLKITNFVDTASLVRRRAIGDHRFDGWLNRKFLQDYDFFLGLALKGLTFAKCPDATLNYRVHARQHGYQQASAEKLQKYIENYSYIIEKYKKIYPEEFEGVIELGNSMQIDIIRLQRTILELHQATTVLRHENAELHKNDAALRRQNVALRQEIEQIHQSVPWKVNQHLKSAQGAIKKKLPPRH